MSEKKTPEEISRIRAAAGKKGGESNSAKKIEAARENGKKGKSGGSKGGRPPLDENMMSDAQRKRRKRYLDSKK